MKPFGGTLLQHRQQGKHFFQAEADMKFLNLLLLLFLPAVVVVAQEASKSSPAPDIIVLGNSWKSEQVYPSLNDDPMRPNEEQIELERERRQNQRDNAIRSSLGLPPLPPPMGTLGRRTRTGPPSTEYVYQAKFQNTGTREIKKLVWEYIFFDPSTQAEIGRRRYESEVSLRPGKTKTVVVRNKFPPTRTINAGQVGKKKMEEQYTQQVVIQSIDYKDGSQWQRPAN
jgi:hypothetical protein